MNRKERRYLDKRVAIAKKRPGVESVTIVNMPGYPPKGADGLFRMSFIDPRPECIKDPEYQLEETS